MLKRLFQKSVLDYYIWCSTLKKIVKVSNIKLKNNDNYNLTKPTFPNK